MQRHSIVEIKSRHGLDMLAEVPDLRNPRGKRHPLSAILGLAVVAMLCGYRSYSAIAEWGRAYPPELAVALGFTRTKTPCASTLHYCFKDLNVNALENSPFYTSNLRLSQNLTDYGTSYEKQFDEPNQKSDKSC